MSTRQRELVPTKEASLAVVVVVIAVNKLHTTKSQMTGDAWLALLCFPFRGILKVVGGYALCLLLNSEQCSSSKMVLCLH